MSSRLVELKFLTYYLRIVDLINISTVGRTRLVLLSIYMFLNIDRSFD